MSTIILIIKFLLALKDLFFFLKGTIDEAQFNERMKKSRELVAQASAGSLEARLKAAKELQDEINKHAPK